MSDQATPSLTDAQAQAWDTYLTETTDPRERYAKEIDAAHAAYEQVKATAEAAHRAINREAWERYQATCCAAWHDYQSGTRDAAMRRQLVTEHAVSQGMIP